MAESNDKGGLLMGCLAVAGIGAVVIALGVCLTCVKWSVPPGHVGVIVSRGDVSNELLQPGGPYLVRPWATVQEISLQVNRNDEPATVPTAGGLSADIHSILLYRIDPAKVTSVVKEIGMKFEEKIVDPYFKNTVRDVCSEFPSEALYTAERQKIESKILLIVTKELGPKGFICDQVMLQDPKLPKVVTDQINSKIAAEQDAIRMQSVFKSREQEALANKRQKELEAEAKVIEAKGIAEAQSIIKRDLDHQYLIYLWIEALKESAKHNNATIYIPTGGDGMPLFKGIK